MFVKVFVCVCTCAAQCWSGRTHPKPDSTYSSAPEQLCSGSAGTSGSVPVSAEKGGMFGGPSLDKLWIVMGGVSCIAPRAISLSMCMPEEGVSWSGIFEFPTWQVLRNFLRFELMHRFNLGLVWPDEVETKFWSSTFLGYGSWRSIEILIHCTEIYIYMSMTWVCLKSLLRSTSTPNFHTLQTF